MRRGKVGDLVDEIRHIDVADTLGAGILVKELLRVLDQLIAVGLVGGRAERGNALDQLMSVAGEHCQDHILDRVDILITDVSDHAEVDPIGLAL